jgi:Concanavalin A-like lectin/glucanases superfamily
MQPTVIRAGQVTGAPPAQSGITDFTSSAGSFTCGNLPQISFQGSAPWTVEVWVYLDALLDQMPLLSRAGEFLLATQGDQVFVQCTGRTPALLSPPVLAPRTWTSLAVAFDGATLALYVNGRRVATSTPFGSGVANAGQPFTIGGGFYGQMESVRLWNAYVSPGQLYDNQWTDFAPGTRGLVAQIDFTQDPPVDTSGNGTPVRASASGVDFVTFTPAVTLTTDAFADTYEDGTINPGGQAQDFSIMAWVCPTTLGDAMYVFSNGPAGGNAGAFLSVLPGGAVQFQVGSSTPLTSNALLQEGVWTSVAATWQSATGTGTLFIDGAQDSTRPGMTLAGTLAAGAPLVGAVSEPPGDFPVDGFEGHLQQVSVWNVALAADQVLARLTAPAAGAAGCVAAYDFTLAPAQNQVTFNPVGLAGGAALTVVETSSGGFGERQVFRTGRPRSRLGRDDWGVVLDEVDEALLSDETHERLLEDHRGFLAGLGIAGEHAAELEARFTASLERARADVRAGAYRAPLRATARREDGQSFITLEAGGERVEVPMGALDACTTWTITFLIAIGGALFAALGFTLSLSKVSAGLTTLLGTRINSIGLLPQLAAVFRRGVTASAVWKSILLLYEFKLLFPMVKLLWQGAQSSVSIWTVFSVGARLLLLLGPSAPLEVALVVTELGYSVYGVATQWGQRPAGCLSSAAVQAGAPVVRLDPDRVSPAALAGV